MEKTFTLSDIKNAAYEAMEAMPDNELPAHFKGIRLLITQLEGTTDAPAPAEKREKKSEKPDGAADFVGYGARLKRELHTKLTKLRERGMTMEQIAQGTGGLLTAEDIRAMLAAEKLPFAKWEALEDVFKEREAVT